MTSIIISVLICVLCMCSIALYQRSRSREYRHILRRQDERIKALSQELTQKEDTINALRKEAKDNFAHYSREIHEIHSRIKRCETALGIESGRRNVRGDNNERRNRALGEGSPLPATYAQRAPRTKSK